MSLGNPTGSSSQPNRLHRREVPDLFSWVQGFGIYACMVASKQPDRIRQLLAYQTMIVREAHRCGGLGWQAYDTMFRQQAAHSPGTDWSQLNNTLYYVTFLAQQNGRGNTCPQCMDKDHTSGECALTQSRPQAPPKTTVCDTPASDSRGKRGKSDQPCFNWKDGRCSFPYCKYRHVCTRCHGEHRSVHCREAPTGGRGHE